MGTERFKRGLLFFGLALLALPSSTLADNLAGTWDGRYSCDGRVEGQMSLYLEASDGVLTGTFRFVHPDGTGSYSVVGREDGAGGFALSPQDWIDRPAGFMPLALQGTVRPGGRAIEGKLIPCGAGGFLAEPAKAEGSAPPVFETAEPRSGGPLEGVWRGSVACSTNRRGATEYYPLELHLGMDGNGVGGGGLLQVYKARGTGAGPTFEQRFIVSGRLLEGMLQLDRQLVVDRGGAPIALQSITAELDPSGRLLGEVRLNGCQTVELERFADLPAVEVGDGLQGIWAGSSTGDRPTALILQVAQEEAEVQATWPANLPEIERDRLRMSIIPIDLGAGFVVWAPVGFREATGVFAPDASPSIHVIVDSAVYMIAPASDGVEFRAASRAEDVVAAMAGQAPATNSGRMRSYLLAQPSGAEIDALAEGETPPFIFTGSVGGALAAAPSREAQCRVLDEWLASEAASVDIMRLSVDSAMQRLAGALMDERFVPVFGMPFLLTTQAERRSIGSFIRQNCRGQVNTGVTFVSDFVLMSDTQFAKLTAQIANRAETVAWLSRAQARLPEMAPSAESIAELDQMQLEAERERPELLPEEKDVLLGQIERRGQEINANILQSDLEGLSDGGFAEGHLGRLLAIVEQGRDLPPDLYSKLYDAAKVKAELILADPRAEAVAVASTVETSLAGLAGAQAALAPIAAYRSQMEASFGSLDPDGSMNVLYRRIDELRNDVGVQQALADMLAQIEGGGNARAAVLAAASPYISEADLIHAPAFAEIVDRAILDAELRQVKLIDNSTSVAPGEPSMADIASFAFERVRDANEEIRRQEQACLSSEFSDPISALECLSMPAVWTGQSGQFGAVLLAVEKIGCTEEVENVRYICLFSQTIDINLPDGMDLGRSITALTSGEVVDAMFLRNNNNGWQVVWGDLDD